MATDKKISELPVVSAISSTDVSVSIKDNIDYQYTFAQLLSFVSANITTGAELTFGNTLPQNTSGKNGDVFFDTITGAAYKKLSGVWISSFIPPGNSVTGSTILYESGEPGNSLGNDDDSYIDIDTGTFYKKTDGNWSQVFSMGNGPQGQRGNSILNGETDPINSIGINGDFYLNKSTLILFGPKASGVWPAGVSINGISGNTILNGSGNPSNSIGSNGDFYLDNVSYDIYGPKADGDWPVGESLIYAPIEPAIIEIPEGSPLPFIINYAAEYNGYGNDPYLVVDMFINSNRKRIVNDVVIEKNYSAGILNTIHVYGHDSGNGVNTIDNLILTIKT